MYLKVTKNAYLSVSLCLTKGPYDDELSGFMVGRFQVRLLNQTSDSFHHSRTGDVCSPNELASIVCTKEIWFDPNFIKITSLVFHHSILNIFQSDNYIKKYTGSIFV